jgi:hypothetical protein
VWSVTIGNPARRLVSDDRPFEALIICRSIHGRMSEKSLVTGRTAATR